MKKTIAMFLTVAAFAAMITISSCTKTCDAGYEGSDCKTEVRAKYFATYKISGSATNSGGSVTITDLVVVITTSATGVQYFNIAYTYNGDSYLLVGKLDANGTAFTVASQPANGLTYSGSGTLTTSSLTIALAEVDGSTTTNITLTGPRQ